jgi:hypothetical protein
MNSKLQIIPGTIYFTENMIQANGVVVTTNSPNSNPHLFVLVDGQPLPVLGNSAAYPHHYSVSYDPLRDHMAWNDITAFHDRQISINKNEITNARVWRRSEFDEWFVTSCKNTVFAQSTIQDNWTLTFVDIEDYHAFLIWWLEPRGYKFKVTYPFDYRTEYDECVNFTAEIQAWFNERVHWLYTLNGYSDGVTIEFESELEAMVFKLAWSDRSTILVVKQ